MANFINANFLPVEAHIKEHPAWFHRFDVTWTPAVLVFDSSGEERHRIEGYLPKEEFGVQLALGLARIAFKQKNWAEAEKIYGGIAQDHPQSAYAPEAMYWSAVSRYKGTQDHTVLGKVAGDLKEKYPQSVWAEKASPWAGH